MASPRTRPGHTDPGRNLCTARSLADLNQNSSVQRRNNPADTYDEAERASLRAHERAPLSPMQVTDKGLWTGLPRMRLRVEDQHTEEDPATQPRPFEDAPTWQKTLCGICPAGCRVEVQIKDRQRTAIRAYPDHPLGMLCRRGEHAPATVHSEYRLRAPLRRSGPKGGMEFEPTSWDQAFDELVDGPGGWCLSMAGAAGPRTAKPICPIRRPRNMMRTAVFASACDQKTGKTISTSLCTP